MKLKLTSLFLFCFAPFVLNAHSAAEQDTIPYDLHDEHDKTDIYAIQLDSSEEELDEEENQLENIQKEEQAKKR